MNQDRSIFERKVEALVGFSRRGQELSKEVVQDAADTAVGALFARQEFDGGLFAESIELLCEINGLSDPELAAIGQQALFADVVERVCDSFEAGAGEFYDRIFARVVSIVRGWNELTRFDELLGEFGLVDESRVLKRRERVRESVLRVDARIRKVIVLSRVTLGADVAVTSVILRQLLGVLPEAEFVVVGQAKLHDLFGGEPRLRFLEIAYGRSSSLVSRLDAWRGLVELIKNEVGDAGWDGVVIFDPDSRLTQLGLLPLIPADRERDGYFHFDSRSFRTSGMEALGGLAKAWIDGLTGRESNAGPFVALPSELVSAGRRLVEATGSDFPVVALSLGVGGNSRKKPGLAFERRFLGMLAERCNVILDSGGSEEESAEVLAHCEILRAQGHRVIHMREGGPELGSGEGKAVVTWRGGIGSFAGIIASCDGYVGYDSSGQHIAAALGIPCLTLFVNSGSEIFARRWTPIGEGVIRVLRVLPEELDEESLLEAGRAFVSSLKGLP